DRAGRAAAPPARRQPWRAGRRRDCAPACRSRSSAPRYGVCVARGEPCSELAQALQQLSAAFGGLFAGLAVSCPQLVGDVWIYGYLERFASFDRHKPDHTFRRSRSQRGQPVPRDQTTIRGPVVGNAATAASRRTMSRAVGASTPRSIIRRAIMPATTGAANDVPDHRACPPVNSAEEPSRYSYVPFGNGTTTFSPDA